MARERGTFNFSASLEVKKQAPLDARQTCITYEELTQQATWADTDGKVWLFTGLVVPVNYSGQHALFMLINPNAYTSTSSWIRVDGGAKSNIYTISDLSTLHENSDRNEIIDIFGEYSNFVDAYNNNKLLLCVVGHYYTVGSVNHEGYIFGEGKFIITINSNSAGNPIITKYVIKHNNNNWLESLGVGSIIQQKFAVAEDLQNLDNIYFLGDILTLTEESSSAIATILTPHSDFKQAVQDKKVFIAKTSLGQAYVNVSAITEGTKYLVTSLVNGENGRVYSLNFTANADGSNWSNITLLTKYSFATTNDLKRYVTRVAATLNKGIEIRGTGQTPTVGIKLDPTQSNVTLSLGANGLKAEDATALRDVTGQNFIKKNGTNVEGHLNLTYNTETKKINLEGFDSSVIASIDATAFIKDGMINTVELVTNPESHSPGTYLVITFNTDAGKDAIYLDVSSLIDVYEGHNGIKVTGKDIHLIIDPTSEPYLSLSDNGIKLKGINSKITEVVEQAIIEAFAWHEV